MHSNLIITAEPIEEAVAFVACYRVEDVVCEWERESIRDRGRVEFPIVDADPYFPVLLWDDYDRAQPCGSFHKANEAHSEEFVDFLFNFNGVVWVHPIAPLLNRPRVG